MGKSGLVLKGRTIPTLEERLKERQLSLTGKPSDNCLVMCPASAWSRSLQQNKFVVAAMCLAEGECEYCLWLLRRII